MVYSQLKYIKEIEQKLGLAFLEDIPTGNLCYVSSNEDLQDDFKQFFTERDLFFFVKSFGENEVEIPKNKMEFWRKVRKGNLDFP